MTEDEMIAQADAHGYPNLRVACPVHGINRQKDGTWQECARPECKPLLDELKARVRATRPIPITDEIRRAWRAQRVGTATQKGEA